MYRQYSFIEKKQQEAKVKVKETDPTCHILFSFVTKGHLETWMRKAILEAKKVGESRNTKMSASWV